MISLSMSAIKSFLRCPKQFEFLHIHGLQDIRPEKEALARGTAFHEYMEYAAKGYQQGKDYLDWTTEMGVVADTYLKHKGLPKNILWADEQHSFVLPELDVKITFSRDLVYEPKPNHIVVRDWKTFSRMPNLDVDLDFQGRFYLWGTYKTWPQAVACQFEKVFIRTTPPEVPKDKKGSCWSVEECYLPPQKLYLSREELKDDEDEFLEKIEFIRDKVLAFPLGEKVRFWRIDQQSGGYSDCSSCSARNLCVQSKQGNLDLTHPWDMARKTDRPTVFEVTE